MQARRYCNDDDSINWIKDLSTLLNIDEVLANCFSDGDVGQSMSWLVWRHDELINEGEFAKRLQSNLSCI